MNYLALDLGTKTGYAGMFGGEFVARTWTLASPALVKAEATTRMDRRLDIRIPNLYDALLSTHRAKPLDWVFFEDVQFSSTTKQTQLWSSLRAAVWLFAHEHKVMLECCPVGTLKKFATGYGGADKKTMLIHARKKYPHWLNTVTNFDLDDNAIDAIHLLAWGIQTVSRGK